jgi:hypothetical protein
MDAAVANYQPYSGLPIEQGSQSMLASSKRAVLNHGITKSVLVAILASLIVSIPIEIASTDAAWAAKRQPPDGACRISHRRVLANSNHCMTSCTSLNWCANMVCNNGQLTQLPLPCHSPEACPATRC